LSLGVVGTGASAKLTVLPLVSEAFMLQWEQGPWRGDMGVRQ
jgi:hypothetical protein